MQAEFLEEEFKMTTSDGFNKKEQEQTADAWARLEKQLHASEQSPLWEQWEAQGQGLLQHIRGRLKLVRKAQSA